MVTLSTAHDMSSIITNEIKMESLHMFDNIDGELNINTSDDVNSETAGEPTDIKIEEIALESGRAEKSVDDVNRSLSNGNAGLKFENKGNNNLPTGGSYESAAIDQNSNITICTESIKALMVVTGKSDEFNANSEKLLINIKKQLTNSSGIELNDSRISNRSGTNFNGSSENDLVLMISDESADSDTDEVVSDSSDSVIVDITNDENEKILQKGELLLEEGQDSDSENSDNNEHMDETYGEELQEKSATIESESEEKSKKKSNANQTTLLKFLIPRQSVIQESSELKKGNDGNPVAPRISISHLILNTCTNCDKGYTTFGIKAKQCRDCGKRMKFTCFICEKLYNTHSGIYGHVVQFHRFSLNFFNEKIHGFIKSNCLKCKATFGSEHSTCSKCNSNLKFGCVVCNEQCDTRPRIHMHVVQNHTEEFVKPSNTGDTNYGKSARIKNDNSVLKDDKDQKDASLIEKTNAVSKKSGSSQVSYGKRKVSFQLDKPESDEEDGIEDSSKSKATGKILCPTPRYPTKRRSIGPKTVPSKIIDSLPDPKLSVSNKRQTANAKFDNSKPKIITEAMSNTKDKTGSKQQLEGRRRSSRLSMNSSEANSVSEAVNNNVLPAKSSKRVDQEISIRRRSSRIATAGMSNSQNEGTSDDIISVSEASVPKQTSNKRRRSKLMNDNSETDDANITIADVHPIPEKYESKQQTTTDRRRSLRMISSSSEASSHSESSSTRAVSTPNVPPVSMQQNFAKRRSVKNTSIKSEISHVENSEMDITSAPRMLAPKSSAVQAKRRNLRSILNGSETNSHNGNTSLGIATAAVIPATGKKVNNKRRKSQSSINVEFDNRSDVSIDESNGRASEVSGLSNCSICEKGFVDPKVCKKHEIYCAKEPNLFCDSCSYATKHSSNLKKHKILMHDHLKNPEMTEANTSGVSFDGTVDYGALYTIDSTCTDILSRMEAHCPKCKDDAKMKPNDSHCRKCWSKLKLSCVRCGKVFPEFLDIFNHLYRECTEKEYHCARCSFATASLEAMQFHVRSEHSNGPRSSRGVGKSGEKPFVFAAQPKAPVNDVRTNLKLGFKTRAQSSLKPAKERAEPEGSAASEGKLKKCPQCNLKVPSLVKHLTQCKEVLSCPFCSYTAKVKQNIRKHLVKCHSTKSHMVKFQAMFIKEKTVNNRPDIEDMMRSYCRVCDELQDSMPYAAQCTACETDLEHRCIKCQARFVHREQLRKHVWCHAKSPNYLRCAGCSKGFAFPENLRMHERVCTADQINTTT